MQLTDKQPNSGQFIRVWIYNNELWSQTCFISNGLLSVYSEEDDNWCEHFGGIPMDYKYIIQDVATPHETARPNEQGE